MFLTYTFLHRSLATPMVMIRIFLLDCLFEVKKLKIYLQNFQNIFSTLVLTWQRMILPQESLHVF